MMNFNTLLLILIITAIILSTNTDRITQMQNQETMRIELKAIQEQISLIDQVMVPFICRDNTLMLKEKE